MPCSPTTHASRSRLVAALGLAAAALAGPASAGDGPRPPAMPRVRVSADGKGFTLAGADRPFVPWGFNYLGKFDHLAEDDWDTRAGWDRIAADFRAMKALGANVVRWHLQFETVMAAPDRPKAGALARYKKLLDLARETGLYLDLTGLGCYRLNRIPAWYDALPEAGRWAAQANFWEAVAGACAGHPAVFCYDLMNEPVVQEAKAGDPPWVGGELGGFYFVQRICNKPAGRDNKDVAAAWVERLTGAIRRHDKDALVTVGVIPWAQVFPGAKPVFYAPRAARHLDFVSVHFYPAAGKLDKDLAALAVYDLNKPLIVEETFPLNCSLQDLDRFIDGAKGRARGWVAHYFGASPAEHRNGAKPAGPLVADFLEYWQAKGAKLAPPAAGGR